MLFSFWFNKQYFAGWNRLLIFSQFWWYGENKYIMYSQGKLHIYFLLILYMYLQCMMQYVSIFAAEMAFAWYCVKEPTPIQWQVWYQYNIPHINALWLFSVHLIQWKTLALVQNVVNLTTASLYWLSLLFVIQKGYTVTSYPKYAFPYPRYVFQLPIP